MYALDISRSAVSSKQNTEEKSEFWYDSHTTDVCSFIAYSLALLVLRVLGKSYSQLEERMPADTSSAISGTAAEFGSSSSGALLV